MIGYTRLRVDKNRLPPQTELWKRRFALASLLGMIVGLLCSRAAASVSMMVFGINALWGIPPKVWLQQRWWLLGLGWVALYALSYFWSADKQMWGEHLQVKLPFLLLPLSFALLPAFSASDLRIYTCGLAAIMLSGALYSTSFLWRMDTAAIVESYKYAHVLRTPVYNDHIAFSTAVAVSIAWLAYAMPLFARRAHRAALLVVCGALAVYLHVLAAKTGLAALYIFLLACLAWQIRRNFRRGIMLLIGGVVCAALAFFSLPTLRERAGYSYVTWRSYRMGERHGIYSDAGRVISYNIALRSIAAHPFGVGAGDVLQEMRAGYAKWYPQVEEDQKLWPHNQLLTCAMAAGIPAALLFILWLMAPLRRLSRNRKGFFFGIVWAMLLVPLLVDPFLEVQFGVAVFLIFLLMQHKELAAQR